MSNTKSGPGPGSEITQATEPLKLSAHMQEAYSCVQEHFKSTSRTCAICATGTGKSTIALKLVEDNLSSRFLFITSSKDGLGKFEKELYAKAFGYAAGPHTVTSSIYQNLDTVYRRIRAQDTPAYDYIIIDEFHHYGAPTYETYIRDILDLNPDARVLGLTATPVRSCDGRDISGELFHGDVAYRLMLPEAVRQGILPTPRMILCRLFPADQKKLKEEKRTKGEIAHWRNRTRQEMNRVRNLTAVFREFLPDRDGHYIIFCRTIAHLLTVAGECPKWFEALSSGVHVFKDYSGRRAVHELNAFAACKDPGVKILLCVNRINESVHPDCEISGLIFLRRTHSQQIYLQQLGRALSVRYKDSTPVIFDFVGNSKVFDMILDTLHSMTADRDDNDSREIPFIVDFREQDRPQTFMDMLIGATLMQQHIPWETSFRAAAAYFREHGDLRVPKDYTVLVEIEDTTGRSRDRSEDGIPTRYVVLNLYAWLCEQRMRYHHEYGTRPLSPEHILQLESINIEWDYEAYWFEIYGLLEMYYDIHHDINITRAGCPSVFHLDIFLERMRMRYHHLEGLPLTDEQIRLLDRLGMDWMLKSREHLWLFNYRQAETYCAQFAPLEFPSTGEYAASHHWLWNQIRLFKAGEGSETHRKMIAELLDRYGQPGSVDAGVRRIRACMERLGTGKLRPGSEDAEERACYNLLRYITRKYLDGTLSTEETELLKKEQLVDETTACRRTHVSNEILIRGCETYLSSHPGKKTIPVSYRYEGCNVGRRLNYIRNEVRNNRFQDTELVQRLRELGLIIG